MKGRLLFIVLVFGLAILLGFNILSYAKQNPLACKERPRKEFNQKNSQEDKEHLFRCPKDKTKNSFMPKSFKNPHHKFDIFQKNKFNIKPLRNRINSKPKKWEFTNRQNNNIQSSNSISYSELDEIIEIDTDITTNTIWESGNVYHVTANVNVQALLVIEPGTVVQYSSSGSLFVNNGGTLIARGTPNNLITFTSDSATPGYSDYYCAIYIEDTASVSTQITYSVIEFAYVGIFTNNIRLDSPIQNNYIQYCAFGIGEFGTEHTDIANNQIFGSYYHGIEIYMASETAEEDSGSHILIQNNTCDYYQYTGITVHGVTVEENAGVIMLANNIVSESYQYGLNFVDGYMAGYVLNTGYYGNNQNKNWEFEETDPVIATEFPYITGEEPLEMCFLDQSCPFIDAGFGDIAENAQLICSTTSLQENVDADTTDIGFHYPNFGTIRIRGDFNNNDTVNADDIDLLYAEINSGTNNPICDLTNDGLVNKDDMDYMLRTLLGTEYGDANLDCKVDNVDLGILSSNWLESGQGWADGNFNGDEFVNFIDYAMLANNWGFEGEGPAELSVEVSGDPDNLEDVVEIGITGYTDNTSQVFLFMDGEYIGPISSFRDEEVGFIGLDSYRFSNGLHELKVVGFDYDGSITLSSNIPVNFNNVLYHMQASYFFKPSKDYNLCAMYSGSYDLSVNIVDFHDSVVWSNSVVGNVNLSIPTTTFTNKMFYDIVIEEVSGGLFLGEVNSSDESKNWQAQMLESFDKKSEDTRNAVVLITLPDKQLTAQRRVIYDAIGVLIDACIERDFSYVILYDYQCTEKNIEYMLTGAQNVRHWYHIGHGNCELGKEGEKVQRTFIEIFGNKRIFSIMKRDYGENVPPDYQELPEGWEQNGISMTALTTSRYYAGIEKLRITFFDSCYSAKYEDMAEAVGIHYPPAGNSTYCGWDDYTGRVNLIIYNWFIRDWWSALAGGATDVNSAWLATCTLPKFSACQHMILIGDNIWTYFN
ncbi:hypothetical protein KAS42_00310 [bacterium]|nr:hypothetical protein [bacterium]